MKIKHVLWIYGFFLFALSVSAQSDALTFYMDEGGKITSFYDEYYIYRIIGNITITNPTNVSIQPFSIPLYLSTLDIRDLNSSYDYFSNGKLVVDGMGPQSSVTIPYRIVGISTEWLNTDNKSILYNAITYFDSKVYSSLMGSLRKGPIEEYNVTGRHARIITIRFDNPTGFRYHVDKVKVIKTTGINITDEVAVWNFPQDDEFNKDRTTLEPHETWVLDFLDKNAVEGEVYWLTSDIYMKDLLFLQNHSIRLFDQDDLFIPFNDTNLTDNLTDVLGLLQDRIFIRKFSSHQLINPGNKVNISLVINNLEPHAISVVVLDQILSGFKVARLPPNSKIIEKDGRSYIMISSNISYSESRRITYQLEYTDYESVGQDYFPSAELFYKNRTFYSQKVQFIKQYVPQKKVFVQKRLNYLSSDDVEVKLMVQNMGESKIEHLVLKEFLAAGDEFKEISAVFEDKGLWKIETLGQGEIWEVRYVTNQHMNLNSLPELFGVPKESILKTIILNNMIKTGFFNSAARVIEYIGLTVVVLTGLIVILLQFRDSVNVRKKRKEIIGESEKIQDKNLHKISSMLHTTKDQIENPSPASKTTQLDPAPKTSSERSSFKSIEDDVHSRHRQHFEDLDSNKRELDDLKNNLH